MGLIEQAAARLAELRRAGVEVPEAVPAKAAATPILRAAPAEASPVAGGERPARHRGPILKLDLVRLAQKGIITPATPRSTTADEFRVIKRPLLANAGKASLGRSGNLIMVTSAIPGEGKTFCATNLAMSMAMELDRTVLLVDADVARPSLPKTLGVPPSLGLMDVLQGKIDLAEALHHTNVDNLTFLSAGTQHPRATELLSSEAMGAVVKDLSTRYADRIVIFDSPPLLVTTEAQALASRMGQIVFVVHAESTLRHQVAHGLATIETCPVKLVVLNAATTPAQGAYGYGYGYGSES